MHLRPRNPKRDRLVNEPLAAYSYFQIGERPWGQGPGLFWILGSAFDPGWLFSESVSAMLSVSLLCLWPCLWVCLCLSVPCLLHPY